MTDQPLPQEPATISDAERQKIIDDLKPGDRPRIPAGKTSPSDDSLTLATRSWAAASVLMFIIGFIAMADTSGSSSSAAVLAHGAQVAVWVPIWFNGGFIFAAVAGICGALRAHRRNR